MEESVHVAAGVMDRHAGQPIIPTSAFPTISSSLNFQSRFLLETCFCGYIDKKHSGSEKQTGACWGAREWVEIFAKNHILITDASKLFFGTTILWIFPISKEEILRKSLKILVTSLIRKSWLYFLSRISEISVDSVGLYGLQDTYSVRRRRRKWWFWVLKLSLRCL